MALPNYYLLLDRSDYRSHHIEKLEPRLEAFARSEGEKTFYKSDVVSIDEANELMKEMCWIEDGKYNGRKVTHIHWYNEQLYIIQTK